MKISVSSFKGTVPLVQPRLLANTYAQTSVNVKYDSGSLVPYSACSSTLALTDTTPLSTIHKYAKSSSTYTWLRFTDRVFLATDPIFADTNNRTIITGLDAPRIFDITSLGSDTTIDSGNSYLLGLPIPSSATIAASGSGSGTPETRSYVIQYDRIWSDGKIDAGPWSNPAATSGGALTVDVLPGESVIISNIPDAPSGYGITNITINRSATSSSATSYQYVYTFDITDAKNGHAAGVTWNGSKFTYTDDVLTTNLGSVSVNQLYTAPPATMDGLISLNNGILAAFDSNYVYFSEPFQCHAWPDKYKIAIDRNVIGLGSFSNNVVVCTDAEPQLITVSDPAAAIAVPIKDVAPCVSAAGIVSFRDAVVYPSYKGFIRIDSAGITNMTQSIASSANIESFAVTNMSAVGLDNNYYGIYLDANNQKKILVINMLSPDFGFGTIHAEVDCAFVDKVTSTIYVAYKPSSNSYAIGSLDKDTSTPLKYVWKSKVFSTEDDTTNFSAARIRFNSQGEEPSTQVMPTVDLTQPFNSTAFNVVPFNGYAFSETLDTLAISFKLYANGSLVFTKDVYTSKPFRLPSGYVASNIEFELSGYLPVYEVDIATAMSELSAEGGE